MSRKPSFFQTVRRPSAALSILLLFLSGSAAAGEIPFKDASALLGADLETILVKFGVPASVSSVRGEAAWQDDVVFRYSTGISFFWFKDRVWQIRLEKNYPGTTMGLSFGNSKEAVETVLGKPFYAEGNWSLYHYAGEGIPFRARLFFDDKGLEDLYIYRGDF